MTTPAVALESTVISHGLPYPCNLQLAQEMEAIIRSQGATPHTVGIIAGELIAGLDAGPDRTLGDSAECAQSQPPGPADCGGT